MRRQPKDLWSQRLKQQTRQTHDMVERAAAPLLAPDLTLGSYRNFLSRMIDFISLHEDFINESCQKDPWISLLDYHSRQKLPYLLRDYHQLDPYCLDKRADLSKLNRLEAVPLKTTAQRLGFLYVIEGSTLGGLIIAKKLERLLQLSNIGGIHYFNIYGYKTRPNWDQFLEVLNTYCDKNPNEYEAVLESALQTFTSYHVTVQYPLIPQTLLSSPSLVLG